MKEDNNIKKCYNSISCILSVLIIVFVLGTVIYDLTVSKPAMRDSLEGLRIEVEKINEKIDAQYSGNVYVLRPDSLACIDSIETAK